MSTDTDSVADDDGDEDFFADVRLRTLRLPCWGPRCERGAVAGPPAHRHFRLPATPRTYHSASVGARLTAHIPFKRVNFGIIWTEKAEGTSQVKFKINLLQQ